MDKIVGRKEKLAKQFLAAERTYKWDQLITLLKLLGFSKTEAAGSRVNFSNGVVMIKLHKPHPGNEVKAYVIKEVKVLLQKEKLI